MWAHLASNRMGGGVGSRFGEGESQLEVDRRMVRKRITSIRRELKHLDEVRAHSAREPLRERHVQGGPGGLHERRQSRACSTRSTECGRARPTTSCSPRSIRRRASSSFPKDARSPSPIPSGSSRSFRHTLVEAFKSTLDEIAGADLVLHVVDASSDEYGRRRFSRSRGGARADRRRRTCSRVLGVQQDATCSTRSSNAAPSKAAPSRRRQFVSAATGEPALPSLSKSMSPRVASAQDEHLERGDPLQPGRPRLGGARALP